MNEAVIQVSLIIFTLLSFTGFLLSVLKQLSWRPALFVTCSFIMFVGFYIYISSQLSYYYAFLIVVSGILILVTPFIVAKDAFYKVKSLLSSLKFEHFLWFNLIILSVWIFRNRSSEQLRENPVDMAALFRIMLVASTGIIVICVTFISRRDTIKYLLHGIPILMLIYALIALASTFYSVFPVLTLYKSMEIIVDVLTIAFIVSQYPTQKDMKKMIDFSWFLMMLLIVSVWIGAIVAPSKAFRPVSFYEATLERALFPVMLRGIMPVINPNGLGFISGLLSIASLSRLINSNKQRDRLLYLVSFCVSFITLILAQSRTSFIGINLGIIVLLILNRKFKALIVLILIILLIAAYTDPLPLIARYFLRGQTQEQAKEMSGRATWWRVAWKDFMKSPIYGYGFGAGVRYVVFQHLDIPTTSSTMHNSWLEVLINVGIIGFIPIALTFLGTWWILLKTCIKHNSKLNPISKILSNELTAFWTLMSVRLITGGSSFMHDREFLLFLLVAVYAQQIRNLEKKESEDNL